MLQGLPRDLQDVVVDYHYQLHHAKKLRRTLDELVTSHLRFRVNAKCVTNGMMLEKLLWMENKLEIDFMTCPHHGILHAVTHRCEECWNKTPSPHCFHWPYLHYLKPGIADAAAKQLRTPHLKHLFRFLLCESQHLSRKDMIVWKLLLDSVMT